MTIFEALAISDSERIHTQTLAWILKLNNKIFPQEEKIKFLNNLLSPDQSLTNINKIYVETEIKNIDLFIQCDNVQFIIENKLKSSEHSNQTNRYSAQNAIPEKFRGDNIKRHYGFLSLIEDSPQNEDWYIITYQQLHIHLKEIEWSNKENTEITFIEEYVNTLNNLVSAFNEFNNSPFEFPNVFTDASLPKYNKQRYNNYHQDYIRKNNLETIFQKSLMKKIANKLKSNYDVKIEDTNGNALIQVNNIYSIVFNGKTFFINFQMQISTVNFSFKINIQKENYNNSKKNELSDHLENAFIRTFYNNNQYSKNNPSKKLAYHSVSKLVSINSFNTIDSIVSSIKYEIKFIQNNKKNFYHKCLPLNFTANLLVVWPNGRRLTPISFQH